TLAALGIAGLAAVRRCKRRVVSALAVTCIFVLAPEPTEAGYQFVQAIGSFGHDDGQLFDPVGLGADPTGNLWVVDRGNYRIQELTSSGAFVSSFGSQGIGDGQFHEPIDVAVDGSGNLWVTDIDIQRVQQFTSSGTFVTSFGSHGGGDGQFEGAAGISVDG